jgi:hypothetical protein
MLHRGHAHELIERVGAVCGAAVVGQSQLGAAAISKTLPASLSAKVRGYETALLLHRPAVFHPG